MCRAAFGIALFGGQLMTAEAQAAGPGQVRTILQYADTAGRQVLRRPSAAVTRVNNEIRRLVDDMLATMYDAEGVGLAAPQIGVLRRVIVVDVGDGPTAIINPQLEHSEGQEEAYEGCLSIPGYQGKVARAATIKVSGLDLRGRRLWLEATGLLARAILHEVDHLDGILFLDRASDVVTLTAETDLRIVYMGTPAFAVRPLRHLLRNWCHISAVVTQPDRPRGRGGAVRPSPVKEAAASLGLTVLQPASARDPEFIKELQELAPDVIVTCAYGIILPPAVLAIPRLGCLNVHPSLLPEFRGAAPIQRALMAGRERTGVTIYFMDEGMDTGDILLQDEVAIGPTETAGELADRLSDLGAKLLLRALKLVAADEAPPRRPQDHQLATYAPALKSQEERLDWRWSTVAIANHCRGLAPRPGAYTMYKGQRLKILQATALAKAEDEINGSVAAAGAADGPPGTILAVDHEDGFIVAAGDGAVLVQRVQPAGRRPMSAVDFINGQALTAGLVLDEEALADEETVLNEEAELRQSAPAQGGRS